jgi:hypothetical protein
MLAHYAIAPKEVRKAIEVGLRAKLEGLVRCPRLVGSQR